MKKKATHSTSTTTLSTARYAVLRRDVQALAEAADRAANHTKVQAFHRLGRRIVRERLKRKSGYHNTVLRDLSIDTRVALRNLQYAVAFVGAYSRVPARGLSWAHYRILLDRPDDASRVHYESIARSQDLASAQLIDLIRRDARVHRKDSALDRPTVADYLYNATVDSILDGDTLDLNIDLGLEVHRNGRFRLACIDCPELPSPAARAARDFVFNRLAAAKTIVVQTERVDLHGRYVTHLFYSDTDLTKTTCFQQGTYLNEQLIDENHALIAK